MEGQTIRKVLYETQRHASRPFTSNYPPQQGKEGDKKSLLTLLSARGVSQLKEKWAEYNQPRNLRRLVSLFVSSRGKNVAVAAGNQITILRKENNYQEPCGIFTGQGPATFNIGTWSESHDILGVVDDSGTLYFINIFGEVITKIIRKHLKIPLPIVGLLAEDNSDLQEFGTCTFTIVTSDGSLQQIEISYESRASISPMRILENVLSLKREFPNNVLSFDYHPELYLFVVVSGPISSLTSSRNCGSSHLSLWRRNANTSLEQLCTIQAEGIYLKPKGYSGRVTYPKVLMSPEGTFVATLDVTGSLQIFTLDKESFVLSRFASAGRYGSLLTLNLLNGEKGFLEDIMDFTWWSDHVLTLVKQSGVVTMVDIPNGIKVQEDNPAYSLPVLERAQKFEGSLFLLESRSRDVYNPSNDGATDKSCDIEFITEDRFNQFDLCRLHWNLITFSERSIPEMYNILISNKKFEEALGFADCHGLDKNEVLKSQWLHSNQGINDINMFLSNIKDQAFVLSECVERVGATEDAERALLAYGLRITDQQRFSEVEDHTSSLIWDCRIARVKLLHFRDRLETYLGINMGRFSVQEYRKFRVMPLNEAAVNLAESGKIGALNLLFKRHPYSLTPFMLEILAAIPETVPVQTYGQLLPGRSPPSSTAVREDDWVECDETIHVIKGLSQDHDIGIQMRTEPIVKQCLGFLWPSTDELSNWYKDRTRAIDSFSGQLDNCLHLLDFAIRKGITELQYFHEDVTYLHQIIYSDDSGGGLSISMSLVTWEGLADYEKFKIMLQGVKMENVVERLRDKAVPFMQNRRHKTSLVGKDNALSPKHDEEESFLVRWLKEVALENKLDICLVVVEEVCRDFQCDLYFRDEVEAVDCALECIYSCTATDRWSTMTAILSKLPKLQDGEICTENLERRLRVAEGHIETGRLLAFYQVPKPLNFFLESHSDGKGVKQILRLILSKFIRRQPGRSDSEWANMWHDLQCLREKAFYFLDLEYMLTEFCRGLLKAGKFSLARNYLKGTSSVALASEKAETLVIQAAREYFFSASSVDSPEIWKAKECLNLYQSSGNVKAEADIIDALTVKLPNLGVTILPMQFRQIKDPMEIVKMAITSQTGAYLHVDELIEVGKLLGLRSPEHISAVEEAIAREAAVAGDLQLAFDLCLVLAKKGHGLIWDLCAAIARGPALENMDISSRKQLLGFALSHCDEESIGELLHAWKDLDLQGQCETLIISTGTNSPNFSIQGSSIISHPEQSIQDIVDLKGCFEVFKGVSIDDQQLHLNKIKNILSDVARTLPVEDGTDWESVLSDNGKILSFAALQLPWLLELSKRAEHSKKFISAKQYVSVKTQAAVTIISWLAGNGFSPTDNLIALLAKSIFEPPATEEEDITGCSYLLNLVDAFTGVEIIEEQLKIRKDYQEVCSIMNVGMTYSLLHNSGVESEGPAQRRELLRRMFKEKHVPLSSDEISKIDSVQSTFWREWKMKLEEQKRVADHSRALEKIIPGVETDRFLSGDSNYIESVVLSLVESVKFEKKHILKDILKLAETYGLNCTEVLLQCVSAILVSNTWTNDDITTEISEFKGAIISHAAESVKTISLIVYPLIDGCNKFRLSYIYGLLSECYMNLEETKESLPMIHPDQAHICNFGLSRYYNVIEQECRNVSFIKNLNFKNIAGLGGLNFQCFRNEVHAHIDESSLEVLAKMVQSLVSIYNDSVPEGLLSWQDVYKHYVWCSLQTLETCARTDFSIRTPENLQGFISKLEQSYDLCRMYIKLLRHSDALEIMKRYFTVVLPLHGSYGNLPDNSTWQDCLIMLLNFWIRLTDEMKEIAIDEKSEDKIGINPECLMSFLKVFMRLVMEDVISPSQGWGTIIGYVNRGLNGDFTSEIPIFCRAMVFSGCGFGAVAEVFSETSSECPTLNSDFDTDISDLPSFYLDILESTLQELVCESHEHQNLYHLLSSLSKLEGHFNILKSVRHVVWERMVKFSDNLQVPSSVRVYVLELLQFISGRSIKGFSAEIQANVVPWEGWDVLNYTASNNETDVNKGLLDHKDSSSRFTNTLVALKSSHLAASISPSIEINPDDLLDVSTAVSCFLRLCRDAKTGHHFDVLLAIMEEWEGLFCTKKDGDTNPEASDVGNDWINDNWDDGWESLQEVEPLEKENEESPIFFHVLHVCWLEIFKKLMTVSRYKDVLRLIDQSSTKSNGILLDEDDARSLSQMALEIDCFLALKMALLLPYETLQLQYLDAVEAKLKQGGISNTRDREFLILVFSSGATRTVITESTYGATSSYICYLVGNLSRQCQEIMFSSLKGMNFSEENENELLLFTRILFPCFISELVKADQQVLAGFLVTKFMHTNASLSLINIAEASLTKYLEGQLNMLQSNEVSVEKTCITLKNAIGSLRSKMNNLIQSALALLSANLR
ncbi:MAG2-interacting protein 2 [Quillaja saponaria]|uniref:MAG2-interacting protein 2 n=1 Tax=Quillaja saponaria TaxID=32244 RepID=A0AAD7LW28_QUISA|nr:MAG2-interacting protein 2 [Quillaja saponaria]